MGIVSVILKGGDVSDPVIDFTEEPEEVLVDLINIYNGTRFTTGQLLFGMPQPYPSDPKHNTSLVVYAKKKSGYKGQVTMKYQRLDINQQIGVGESTVFEIGNATNLSDLIGAVNSQLGIRLDADDFLDAPLVLRPGGETNLYQQNLVILDYSLLYVGALAMTIKTNELALKDVILKPVLNAFSYTPPA
jgi:hypothetical protein